MIRFNCPHCDRYYELSPALALLPLLCKQCGQRITPPAAPDPPPPAPPRPKPVAPPLPVAKLVQPPPAKPPEPSAPVPKPAKKPLPPVDDDEDDGILVAQPDESPDVDFNVGGPTAASLSDAARARPGGLSDANRPRPTDHDSTRGAGGTTQPNTVPEVNLELIGLEPSKRRPQPVEPEAPPAERPQPTLVPFIADLIVFLALVVGGMFVGEFLAQKPTGEVLSEAGSAPKFPPVELILWGGPPVALALIYLLLGSRQLSAGAWLRRRAAK